ncbi:hypothetical protein YC2023_017503 [Brassica napus]
MGASCLLLFMQNIEIPTCDLINERHVSTSPLNLTIKEKCSSRKSVYKLPLVRAKRDLSQHLKRASPLTKRDDGHMIIFFEKDGAEKDLS